MRTTAIAWPNVSGAAVQNGKAAPEHTNGVAEKQKVSPNEDIKGEPERTRHIHLILTYFIVEPKLLDEVIRSGCTAAIAAEPNLTKWDMVMGDGDCGEAVQGVSEGNSTILTNILTHFD